MYSEINFRIARAKTAFSMHTFFHQQIGLKDEEEMVKVLELEHSCVRCWNWNIAVYGAGTGT